MNKLSLLSFVILFFFACAPDSTSDADNSDTDPTTDQEETTPTTEPQEDKAINDKWMVDKIEGENFVMEDQEGLKQHPQIEIIVMDGQFQGNDGCNTIRGKIESTEQGMIQFTNVVQTKMACPNTNIPDQFTAAINATRKYNAQANYLFLYDENNKELLRFKKVK